MTSAAYAAKTLPAGLARTLRPTRSVSSTPNSRVSADTAADTDGWDTTSSPAAAVTEPVRTTARKLRSCVTVTAIWLRVLDDPIDFSCRALHQVADPGSRRAGGRRALAGADPAPRGRLSREPAHPRRRLPGRGRAPQRARARRRGPHARRDPRRARGLRRAHRARLRVRPGSPAHRAVRELRVTR